MKNLYIDGFLWPLFRFFSWKRAGSLRKHKSLMYLQLPVTRTQFPFPILTPPINHRPASIYNFRVVAMLSILLHFFARRFHGKILTARQLCAMLARRNNLRFLVTSNIRLPFFKPPPHATCCYHYNRRGRPESRFRAL